MKPYGEVGSYSYAVLIVFFPRCFGESFYDNKFLLRFLLRPGVSFLNIFLLILHLDLNVRGCAKLLAPLRHRFSYQT